jgi:Fe-S oxidoreductase
MDRDRAREEMVKTGRGEDSILLEQCACCYGCEEYCPQGNHPCYLISDRRDEKGILAASRPVTDQFILIGEPRGQHELGMVGEVALSFCKFEPLKAIGRGKLFEQVASSYVAGAEFMCPAVYLHFGKTSVIKERLPRVIERISGLGIKQLICLHDECYGTFTSIAPAFGMEVPFKPVHYLEYVHGRLQELKSEITPLNITVAHQRPCSSRLSSDKFHFVKNILDLIGVELVDRKYQGETTLCCGEPMRVAELEETADDVQQRNIADMLAHQVEYCIFNCPACQIALSEKVSKKGIVPLHITDLCKMALGETVEPGGSTK